MKGLLGPSSNRNKANRSLIFFRRTAPPPPAAAAGEIRPEELWRESRYVINNHFVCVVRPVYTSSHFLSPAIKLTVNQSFLMCVRMCLCKKY
jgi:hypothetical protein